MPLTWDLTRIRDYKTTCWIENEDGTNRLNPVTEALIFMTMSVKLGSITEANADEFYARMHFVEQLGGPFLTKKGEPYWITAEDVHAHIGLVCNVTTEPTAKFFTSIRQNYFTPLKAQYREAVEKDPVTA